MLLATLSGGDDKLEPPKKAPPCHPGGWYAAQHGKFGLHFARQPFPNGSDVRAF